MSFGGEPAVAGHIEEGEAVVAAVGAVEVPAVGVMAISAVESPSAGAPWGRVERTWKEDSRPLPGSKWWAETVQPSSLME